MIGVWVEDDGGGFVNLSLVVRLSLSEITAGTWVINAGSVRLLGTYSSESDARDAARRFVHGVSA